MSGRCDEDEVIRLKEAGRITQTEIGKRVGVTKQRVSQILHPKPKPSLETKPVLRSGEVAQLLGVHANTVRRWNAKGILKSYRIGLRGDRRFRREDVDGFLRKGLGANSKGGVKSHGGEGKSILPRIPSNR